MANGPNWWDDLENCWSEKSTTFLTSGEEIHHMGEDHYLGEFIFHRFFGSDDYDSRDVKVVLVELKRWTQWKEWLKVNKTTSSLLPVYAHRLEEVIISRKSFRVVRWVDEYRPFDFRFDPLV